VGTPVSDGSIQRRAFLGTVSNMGGQAVVIVCSLALVPIIVHRVGAADYGIWIVVDAVVTFVYLVDAGMSLGLVKYVSEYDVRGEPEKSARMYAAAFWFYALVGAAVAGVGCAVAFGLSEMSSLEEHTRAVLPGVVAFSALGVGISIPGIAPVAVLQGLQRFALLNTVLAVAAVLGVAATIVALALDTGIVGVAAANAVCSVITFLAMLLITRRVAPTVARASLRDRSGGRQLFSFSIPVAVIQVADRLQSRADAIVIGAALPVPLVTAYNLGQRLAEGTRLVAGQFTRVLLPIATTSGGAEHDLSALRAVFLTSTRISLALALSVALPLALLGDSVLVLWVGEAFRGHGDVIALLAISTAIDLGILPAAAVLQSIEKHRPLAKIAIGSAVANVVLSIALVGPFGIVGVAAATLVTTTVECLAFVLPYTARTLAFPLRDVVSEVVLRLVTPVVLFSAILLGADRMMDLTSFAQLVAAVAVALAVFAGAYVLTAANEGERAAYLSGARAAAAMFRAAPSRSA
jgi:O-antigen/teichoic acid export membrane protein